MLIKVRSRLRALVIVSFATPDRADLLSHFWSCLNFRACPAQFEISVLFPILFCPFACVNAVWSREKEWEEEEESEVDPRAPLCHALEISSLVNSPELKVPLDKLW